MIEINNTNAIDLKNNRRIPDLSGKKFGHLKVLFRFGIIGKGLFWYCSCVCGKALKVEGGKLIRLQTKSCGCKKSEMLSKAKTVHGKWGSREYISWSAMIQRCKNPNNPNYKHYGGRGIRICRRWIKFENFLSDMGSRPNGLTLERIKNSEDYSPKNCKWATRSIQSLNTRRSRLIKFKGETKNLCVWSSIVGLERRTISRRLRAGWSVRKSLTTPATK